MAHNNKNKPMSVNLHTIQEVTTEVVRAAPPVAVSTAIIAGISVQDWAAILTGIYVILMIFFMLKRELKKKDSSVEKAVSDDKK